MGNITISLEDADEAKLRRFAREKYGGKKGSLAKIVSEGLEKMENESEREKTIRSLKAKMEKGFNSGGILIKHRSELYDRR